MSQSAAKPTSPLRGTSTRTFVITRVVLFALGVVCRHFGW